jgi:hypothetical protein
MAHPTGELKDEVIKVDFDRRQRVKYAIRLPANQVLQNRIGYLLKRMSGTPSLA